MDLDLSGKHALVCGASDGIGRAAAQELASLGADVTVLARREEALREVVASLPNNGRQSHAFVVADLGETTQLAQNVVALVARKPVHILINNAGGPPAGRAIDADPAAFLAAYTRHLIAAQVITQTVVPGMRVAGYGRILNIISTSVYEPLPNLGVSNTTRGAMASWAKTLSNELASAGITVNNVLPGFTETGRMDQLIRSNMEKTGLGEAAVRQSMLDSVPARRFAQPAETGAVIAFLCSPAAGYINGQSIAVDGGRMQSI